MTNSKPLFSIVIPCYNYGHVIERAVSSVMLQTCDDFEVLVINDGSTDSSEGKIADLQKKHVNLKAIHNTNQGPAATRNCGIRNTEGKFLIFLDADDELLLNALEKLKEHHCKKPNDRMIIGGHISMNANTKKEKLHTPTKLPSTKEERFAGYLIDKTVRISNGATAMHRCLFDHYQYPEKFRNSEDIPVFSYVLANFDCGSLEAPINKIHSHADSLRHNTDYALQIGLSIVDEVFSPERIDSRLLKYKNRFLSQRCLSLFRTLYLSGRTREAKKYYAMAIKFYWLNIFKISYLKKYLTLKTK